MLGARPTLKQLASEYRSRSEEDRVVLAPHPLPTKELFKYDFIFENEEERRRKEEELQRKVDLMGQEDLNAGHCGGKKTLKEAVMKMEDEGVLDEMGQEVEKVEEVEEGEEVG